MDQDDDFAFRVVDLFIPVLRALSELGGSASNEEIEDRVASNLKLPQAALDRPHKGGSNLSRFAYRSAWCRSWLKNAGLVDNSSRGVWTLTQLGRSALAEAPDPLIQRIRQANRDTTRRRRERSTPIAPDGDPALSVQEPRVDWREQLLDVLGELKPDAFERLCQRMLRESGFVRVEVTGKAGDGGIDGTGVLRINLLSFQVLFQCKRWKGSVGSSVVRDFRGAMVGRADKGLIITTGAFTQEARREATRDGAPAIDLVDGETLCDELKKLGLGVSVQTVEEVSVNVALLQSM